MTTLAELSLDLFLAGHAHLAAGRAGDGRGLERRVADYLDHAGMPNSNGFRVFGRRSLSGLYHQLDEQTACSRVLVVGEWKAYTGQIPKNELLRFKAATDDYWLSPHTRRDTPLIRIFGGTGLLTPAMRTYAAHWGIVLITPDRWPIPTLCEPYLLWNRAGLDGPSQLDVRVLRTLGRPLADVLHPMSDGSWRVPPMADDTDLAHRLRLWQRWSDRAWKWWDDAAPSRFDWLLDHRLGPKAAA
jgi:hypothetical protein